jgi:hypothetical protein
MQVRLAATLWMAAAAVSGAEPSMPMVGERVRVETRSREWVTGAVLALDDGGLSISGQKAARRLAWSEVEWVDVSRGRKRHTVTGALVFGGLGGLAGGFMGNASCALSDIETRCESSTTTGTLVGAAVGGALGAAIGSSIAGDRWEQARDPRLSLELEPRRGGAGARLSLRF